MPLADTSERPQASQSLIYWAFLSLHVRRCSATCIPYIFRTPYIKPKQRRMARTVRNAKLDTRSARSRLTARREPYWTVISGGCALGYRRGANGGTWIGRFRDDTGRQHYQALGATD